MLQSVKHYPGCFDNDGRCYSVSNGVVQWDAGWLSRAVCAVGVGKRFGASRDDLMRNKLRAAQ